MRAFLSGLIAIAAVAAAVVFAAPAQSDSRALRTASSDGMGHLTASPALTYVAAEHRNDVDRYEYALAARYAALVRYGEHARARWAPAQTHQSSSGGAVGGSCEAMKPAGFPDYIIHRESRGDPNAVNASSGALGCAQILPSHFRAGCAGMSYQACWAYLWADGRGASNWSTG